MNTKYQRVVNALFKCPAAQGPGAQSAQDAEFADCRIGQCSPVSSGGCRCVAPWS